MKAGPVGTDDSGILSDVYPTRTTSGPPTYLWDELQADGCVYRDVAAHTYTNEGGEDEEGVVIVGATKGESKDRREQDGEVESPSTSCMLVSLQVTQKVSLTDWARVPTDNVYQESPYKCTCSSMEVSRAEHESVKLRCAPAVSPAEKDELMFPVSAPAHCQRKNTIIDVRSLVPPNPNSCCTGPNTKPNACAQSKSMK